jgi:hypothetical protein
MCSGNTETTVLAHLPGGAMGAKNEDAFSCFVCWNCHDAIDGRSRTKYTRAEIRLMFLEGMVRTQRILFADGLLLTKAQADHNRRAQERGDYTHEDNAAG